ncbi:MAG: NAD(P)H-dependent glycerol-3-phosphate dehydrogenase [Candidatus Kapaibacterium sp.]
MTIGCIGAGSWGTTLGVYLAERGHHLLLYVHDVAQQHLLQATRENRLYLPGVPFPATLEVTGDVKSLASSDVLLIATPTQFIRNTISPLSEFDLSKTLIVNSSKGIERGTLMRVSEIIADVLNVPLTQIVSLSGPSHAEEVSRSDPAALVAASSSLESAERVQNLFNSETLRIYSSDDIIGVELGGALKNVIALCAGIVDGAEFGDNTKAALITRGLAEITRLGVALGARSETFSGLSGLGDLIVTCTSRHSRNRYVGEQIGRGRKLQEIIDEMSMVAEGVTTTESAFELSRRTGVEMPIVEQVHQILFEGKETRQAITDLMTRSTKPENW